ncbi:MAG TPA: PA2169 family four-helix-bundle protein [Planctomycetaceae bacterium]
MAYRSKAEREARTATAERLCELHQADLDGGRVFREAARVVSDESVAAICDDLARKRQVYAEELEQYLSEYESEDHGSIKAAVHRAWLDLRASFSTDNPAAVLAEVLRGERRLRAAYEEAVAALAGSPVLGLIQRQLREIKADMARLAALYDAFKRRDAEE